MMGRSCPAVTMRLWQTERAPRGLCRWSSCWPLLAFHVLIVLRAVVLSRRPGAHRLGACRHTGSVREPAGSSVPCLRRGDLLEAMRRSATVRRVARPICPPGAADRPAACRRCTHCSLPFAVRRRPLRQRAGSRSTPVVSSARASGWRAPSTSATFTCDPEPVVRHLTASRALLTRPRWADRGRLRGWCFRPGELVHGRRGRAPGRTRRAHQKCSGTGTRCST